MADRETSKPSTHRIRLVGPWELRSLGVGESALSSPLRVWPTEPGNYPLGESHFGETHSEIVLTRRFNLPTGISPADCLTWEAEFSVPPQQIVLNDVVLGVTLELQESGTYRICSQSLMQLLLPGQNRFDVRLKIPASFESALLIQSELVFRPLSD
ncbi:MAG: hypothetical protein KF851_17725 [Pirellulaceae bacterium]|nr:hypothetical protein [Pirellulaceae bacterium]